jgi:lysozyme
MPKTITQSEPQEAPKDIVLQKARDLIAKFEGCKLTAYKCPAGVWTIGYGHTNGVKEGDKISVRQAGELLKIDTKAFLDCVRKEVGGICNENQLAALTSFTFNFGEDKFRKSTLLTVIKKNPQDFTAIKSEFLRWVYADKKVLKGLKNRRNIEFEMYKKPCI